MKKILNWLKSTKSDFILFLILIVFANIVAYNAFVRFDLTSPQSYTLSKASKSIVKNLEEPLSIRVFFDDNLPAPYNTIAQYVKDILFEYKSAGNKNFSVTYMDMSKAENQTLAADAGLRQMQIQEVKNNEIGFKTGYMGLVLAYGDNVELMDGIVTTDSLEYNITSKISKMINTADALSSLKNGKKVDVKLYLSDSLKTLNIDGVSQSEKIVRDAVNSINKKNMDALDFTVVSPAASEITVLAEQYGVQTIGFRNASGKDEVAVLGLVVSYNDNFRLIPVTIQRSFFGYTVAGLESVEETITQSMQGLLTKASSIGYVTGHNELDNHDETYAGYFDKALSKLYEVETLDLNEQDIPANYQSIIINGPQFDFTEEELYKIDQFIMRGGNVLFFIDGMLEDGTAQYTGGQPFVPNNLNIDRLLTAYGVERKYNMVFDEQCFTNLNGQYGKISYNWAPELQRDQLAKKHPVTKNLGYVYMYQNGELDVSKAEGNKNLKVTVLAKSSERSWTKDTNIMLMPTGMAAPADESQIYSRNLLVLVEGKFNSAFDAAPVNENTGADNSLETSNHIASSIRPGKIIVANSSFITTRNVINENATTPAALLMLNAVDYMNGNEDLCTMRTKSISANTLTIKSKGAAEFWKYFNEAGLAVLVALAGFIVWRMRSSRRRAINAKYNPNDTRTVLKVKAEKKDVEGE